MKTVTMKSHIGSDGMLHLDLPLDLKDADVEITLNIRSDDELMNDTSMSEGPMDDECCIDAEIEEDRRSVVYDL